VIQGMDVVRAIHDGPADGQHLTPPIRIISARRLLCPAAPAPHGRAGAPVQ
jgi:hypothetical protein